MVHRSCNHYRRMRNIRRVRPVTVKVACIQLQARAASELPAALDDALTGIEGAAARGAHIAVLPECTLPGYVLLGRSPLGGWAAVERALRDVAHAARRTRMSICIGAARRDPRRGLVRNEAVYFNGRGE